MVNGADSFMRADSYWMDICLVILMVLAYRFESISYLDLVRGLLKKRKNHRLKYRDMTGGPRVKRHSRDEWINGQCGRIAYADIAAAGCLSW
jgi:hypothetical protein